MKEKKDKKKKKNTEGSGGNFCNEVVTFVARKSYFINRLAMGSMKMHDFLSEKKGKMKIRRVREKESKIFFKKTKLSCR